LAAIVGNVGNVQYCPGDHKRSEILKLIAVQFITTG